MQFELVDAAELAQQDAGRKKERAFQEAVRQHEIRHPGEARVVQKRDPGEHHVGMADRRVREQPLQMPLQEGHDLRTSTRLPRRPMGNPAIVRSQEAAELQVLLEGVGLPARKRDLVAYARGQDPGAAQRLQELPDGEYRSLDDVGKRAA